MKLTISAKRREAVLLGLAAIITIASNGYFQEKDMLALFLKLASGQQIFFLMFQCLGQYQLFSFTRRFFGENVEGPRSEQHRPGRRRNNRKKQRTNDVGSPPILVGKKPDSMNDPHTDSEVKPLTKGESKGDQSATMSDRRNPTNPEPVSVHFE